MAGPAGSLGGAPPGREGGSRGQWSGSWISGLSSPSPEHHTLETPGQSGAGVSAWLLTVPRELLKLGHAGRGWRTGPRRRRPTQMSAAAASVAGQPRLPATARKPPFTSCSHGVSDWLYFLNKSNFQRKWKKAPRTKTHR